MIRKLAILSILAGGLTALPAAQAAPGSPEPSVAGGGVYGDQNGDLPNFHEVHPYLFRGGQPSPAGLKRLKEMGVATIIDLRAKPEQVYQESSQARALGLRYINLPMSSRAPTGKQVRTFLKEVDNAASGRSAGPVFVHCAHGSDRTGCLVGIWRVTHDRYSYDEAYQEMRKYYFGPRFIRLSGAVKEYAARQQRATAPPGAQSPPASQ